MTTYSRSRTMMLTFSAVLGASIGGAASLVAQSPPRVPVTMTGAMNAMAPAHDSTHAVFTLFMSGIAAFNDHALDAFMRQFAPDIMMYTPTGWLKGRDAVRQRFVDTFKQFPRVRMEIDSLEVRPVGENAATVTFRWRTFPRGTGPAFHGVGSGTYMRRDGQWLEVLEHETIVRIDSALAGTRSESR